MTYLFYTITTPAVTPTSDTQKLQSLPETDDFKTAMAMPIGTDVTAYVDRLQSAAPGFRVKPIVFGSGVLSKDHPLIIDVAPKSDGTCTVAGHMYFRWAMGHHSDLWQSMKHSNIDMASRDALAATGDRQLRRQGTVRVRYTDKWSWYFKPGVGGVSESFPVGKHRNAFPPDSQFTLGRTVCTSYSGTAIPIDHAKHTQWYYVMPAYCISKN